MSETYGPPTHMDPETVASFRAASVLAREVAAEKCASASLWPGVTCQKPVHADDRHEAKDARSVYMWSTAAVEAAERGDCPGCQRRVCVCSERCSCGQHGGAR